MYLMSYMNLIPLRYQQHPDPLSIVIVRFHNQTFVAILIVNEALFIMSDQEKRMCKNMLRFIPFTHIWLFSVVNLSTYRPNSIPIYLSMNIYTHLRTGVHVNERLWSAAFGYFHNFPLLGIFSILNELAGNLCALVVTHKHST